MGDMKQTINFHYSKGKVKTLIEYANDITIDEEDRELAKELVLKLQK